jgi:1-acyl-sn-glycerol-3-phosphate acyltransferase
MSRGSVRLALVAARAGMYLACYRATKLLTGPSPARALRLFRRWSRLTCATFRIEVRVVGEPVEGHCVYIANHRTYLDIPVLASAIEATFLSNDDVAALPIVGAAARELGVIFVDRGDMHARVRAARALGRVTRGASVIVFPEGTTSGTELPRPFHPGLFRLLHRRGATVVPVTIRYDDRRTYWVENLTMADHLRRNVFPVERVIAEVRIGAPLAAGIATDGDALCEAVQAAVAAPIRELGELVGGDEGSSPQPRD